jgi:hypothetical protein
MNSQIETWRVQQYASNVYHLSQQEGSVIAGGLRKEIFVGKSEFFDRLGKAVAQDKTQRNSDTPNLNIDHSRRMVTAVTREWATLVDRKDKLQNIHSPESEYAKAAQWGLGRKMDQVFIDKAFGNASAGEDGSTSVVLPNTQKVTSVASAAIAVPNIQLLRKAKRVLDANLVKGKRYIYHSADFLEALLADSTITSADYNTVKALVSGELNSFMGFEFKLCQEIDSVLAATYDGSTYKYNTGTGLYDSGGTVVGATDKVALCMAEGSVIHGETQGSMKAEVGPRADKSYSEQVYASIDMGAVRMEDEAVVQLIYKAT